MDAITAAARRPEVVDAVRHLYARAQQFIDAQQPTCWNRGECCRFGAFGHRLFVTTMELAYYLAAGEVPAVPAVDACPHAHDGRCHARDRRPLGCRIFYCDPEAQRWQPPLTERLLAELRTLHNELGVEYVYVDWMVALAALAGQARSSRTEQHARGPHVSLPVLSPNSQTDGL